MVAISSLITLTSCNDELNDELFHKYSYLKDNGWKELTLDIEDDNTAILPIYFGINGTSANGKDIVIQIEHDPDTLDLYNFDRFKNQTMYYFKELPSASYTLDQESYTIPKGSLKTTANCLIDLSKIGDLYNEYVLPIKILSSIGEPAGPNKYTKALYNVNFQNKFSGNYAGYGTMKQIGTSYTTSVSGKRLYATSPNTCYMYAGNVSRTNEVNYKQYVIDLTMLDEKSILLSSSNPDLELKPQPVTINRKYTINYSDLRKYGQETTIKIQYEYRDLTEKSPTYYSYEGTLTMNKDVWKADYPNADVEEDE